MPIQGQQQKPNGHIFSVCWSNSNMFSPKCSEYGWLHFLNLKYAPIGTTNEVRFWMTLMAVIKVTYDVTIGRPLVCCLTLLILIIHLESLRPTLFPRTGLFLHPVYYRWNEKIMSKTSGQLSCTGTNSMQLFPACGIYEMLRCKTVPCKKVAKVGFLFINSLTLLSLICHSSFRFCKVAWRLEIDRESRLKVTGSALLIVTWKNNNKFSPVYHTCG